MLGLDFPSPAVKSEGIQIQPIEPLIGPTLVDITTLFGMSGDLGYYVMFLLPEDCDNALTCRGDLPYALQELLFRRRLPGLLIFIPEFSPPSYEERVSDLVVGLGEQTHDAMLCRKIYHVLVLCTFGIVPRYLESPTSELGGPRSSPWR